METTTQIHTTTSNDKVFNWRKLLGEHIIANKNTKMEWGKFDCMSWSTSCIKLITEKDFYKPFEGKYYSAVGAAKLLLQHATSISTMFDQYYGEMKHIAFAKAGDIVLASPEKLNQTDEYNRLFDYGAGICFGKLSYFVGEDGLIALNTLILDGCYHV